MSPISEGSDPEPSAGALERLTSGVASRSQRDILIECLAGRIPPAIALMRLHDETPDTGAMRAIIDEVTRRVCSTFARDRQPAARQSR